MVQLEFPLARDADGLEHAPALAAAAVRPCPALLRPALRAALDHEAQAGRVRAQERAAARPGRRHDRREPAAVPKLGVRSARSPGASPATRARARGPTQSLGRWLETFPSGLALAKPAQRPSAVMAVVAARSAPEAMTRPGRPCRPLWPRSKARGGFVLAGAGALDAGERVADRRRQVLEAVARRARQRDRDPEVIGRAGGQGQVREREVAADQRARGEHGEVEPLHVYV